MFKALENINGITDTENENKFAVKENLSEDIDTVLNNKNITQEIQLTYNTPSILTSQKGVRNLPMLMKASHIRENILSESEAKAKGLKVNKEINYHGLGKTLFIDVINDLDNINRAYRGTKNAEKSSRRENYFLLISKKTDKDGNKINIPVYINEKGQYNRVFIDTNKISTVFGRDKLEAYIQKEINNGNLVKIKNKNIQTGELTSPINASYGENVSTDIIFNSDEIVKKKSVKDEKYLELAKNPTEFVDRKSAKDSNGNILSEEQQDFFKNSKVRDEDGNLLVVYHGTDKDFTVFDRTKGRANMDIQGMFFSPWDIEAGGYGNKVNAYYLNITNPASESMGYKALRKYQSQNYAGVKAREYLESLGYDGVANYDEYIAFYPEQIKLIDNLSPTENDDIRFSAKDEMNIYEDIYYPKNPREQSVFNRSLANKTNNLTEGEVRSIIVYTATNAYLITVNGYMNGEIEEVIEIDGNEEYIRGIERDIKNGINKESEKLDSGVEVVRSNRRRNNVGNVVTSDGQTGERTSGLDGGKSERNDVQYNSKGKGIKVSYSYKSDADSRKAMQDVLRKNKKLEEANNILKQELRRTKGKMITMKNAETIAKSLVNFYGMIINYEIFYFLIYTVFRLYGTVGRGLSPAEESRGIKY